MARIRRRNGMIEPSVDAGISIRSAVLTYITLTIAIIVVSSQTAVPMHERIVLATSLLYVPFVFGFWLAYEVLGKMRGGTR
jgi:hypothetical protein